MNGYYINLEYRKDRDKHFIHNIKKYDFFKNIKRYNAIYDEDYGEIGCVKSHINVLKLCLEQNDDYYLIMEDDFDIIDEKNLLSFFNSFDNIKNKDWDIITLTPSGDTIYEDKIDNFYRIKNTMTTTGYIIKRNIILELINNFTESLALLVLTNNKEKYLLDKYWFNIQDKVKFYYYENIYATQLIGYSDLEQTNVDLNRFFINQNNYKKTLFNKYLIALINEPYNDMNNFNLGYEYEDIEQTAAALSYYLRCAEFTKNKDLSYECLLRMSKCLSKQNNRDIKELVCIEHAISIEPNRPEAYYIISLYYSYRKNWLKSYMFACIGLENLSEKKLLKNIGYFDKYQLLFQKAYSGYNKGKINESKEIYFDLLNNHNINEYYKNIIENNLKQFQEPSHTLIQYTKDKYDKLKYKFINSEKIENNYSQIYQDMFVLSMYNGKKEGIYIEIGSGDSIYGNNTYLLEKDFNWSGISIDINKNSCNSFIEKRNNECLNVNALEYNYDDILRYGNVIDYLQLDCDPPNITYSILLKIPFYKIKFGVITYEHDYYNDKTKSYRQKSRKYLHNKGYKLIVGNISPDRNNNPFEDWWIHPDLIEESLYKQFVYEEIEYINGEDYMLLKESLKLNLIFFGNDLFQFQKKRLKNEASQTNWFDNIFIESPETIKDLTYKYKNIFKYKRGFGYWVWKPYIILRKLEELNDNDILVYLDCGSSIINNEEEKNKYLNILNNKSIITFANTDHIEIKFQKKRVLKYFNLENDIDFLNSYHIESGCIIIKNNNESREFIKKWFELCIYDNHSLLNDITDNENEDFIEHRHDQSLLSILSKQSDIVYILSENNLYHNYSCFFSSRLTDNGPRKYAKKIF